MEILILMFLMIAVLGLISKVTMPRSHVSLRTEFCELHKWKYEGVVKPNGETEQHLVCERCGYKPE